MRSVILFLLLAAAIVGLVTGVVLSYRSPQGLVIPDEDLLRIQVMSLIGQEHDKAAKLAEDGKHIEAARILVNVAGARRALFPGESAEGADVLTIITEKTALQQLSLVGKAEVYREFLRAMYSEWKAGDMPNERPKPNNEGDGIGDILPFSPDFSVP